MATNKLFLIVCLVLFLSTLLAQPTQELMKKEPLQGKMEIYRIAKVDGQYKRYFVTKAKPGDILEYVITYTNVSQQPLQDIQIVGPIPSESYIVPNTIKMPDRNTMLVSIDGGKTYQKPPIKRKVRQGNKIVEVPVSDKEWTHLKYTVPELRANQTTELRYWVFIR